MGARVYAVAFDGQTRIVEAPNFAEAVRAWLDGMREPWGDDWQGDEEPESVQLISEEPVISVARDALRRLVDVVDAAGLDNLTNGVQLGQTSWYVKASHAMDLAREVIAGDKAEQQP